MTKEELISLGYTTKDASKMIENFSNILTLDKSNLLDKNKLLKEFGLSNNEIFYLTKKVPRLYSRSNDYLINRFNYFVKKGFTKKEIDKILMNVPQLFQCSEKRMEEVFKFFDQKNFDYNEIKNVIRLNAHILLRKTNELEDKYNFFLTKGFNDESIKKISYTNKLIWVFDKKNMNNKKLFEYLEKDLNNEQINKLVINYPFMLTLKLDYILDKLKDLDKYGIKEDEAKNIFYRYPKIVSYSSERLDKVFNLLNNSFDKDSSNVIYEFPAVLGSDIDNLREKLIFIDEKELTEFIKISPKNLIQSNDLTDARYNYFKINNINIITRNLYDSNKVFESRYKLTRDELIDKYSTKSLKKIK